MDDRQLSLFTKTSLDYSLTKQERSAAFLEHLPAKMHNSSRQGVGGRTLVVCLDPKEQWRGGSQTPNISTWPNDAAVCSLSQVLEKGSIPQKYFLSSMACAGILRRAESRGKTLPMTLHRALRTVAGASSGVETLEDKTLLLPFIASLTDKGGAELAIERSPTLTCNHEAPIAVYSVALRGREGGATAELGDNVAGTLRAGGGGGDKAHVLAPIAFDSRQDCVSSTEVFGALGSASPQAQAVCFSSKDHGADATIELAPTMRAMGHSGSHANGGGQLAVEVHGMAVRRLTPKECSRLQGFSDTYLSQVIIRGKPMADGPMYKALGNSWAVNNVAWIGRRIDSAIKKLEVN